MTTPKTSLPLSYSRRSAAKLMAGAALTLLAVASLSPPAMAQAKITRLVVAFPPGGPVDFVARTIGEQLAKELGSQVIIENRAGAPTLQSRRRLNGEHSIEVVGEQLRAMMPWIKKNKLVDQTRN